MPRRRSSTAEGRGGDDALLDALLDLDDALALRMEARLRGEVTR